MDATQLIMNNTCLPPWTGCGPEQLSPHCHAVPLAIYRKGVKAGFRDIKAFVNQAINSCDSDFVLEGL